jgi:AMME syndrome candidate gene 1 protein
VALRELPSLECGITLLTNFEPTPRGDPLAWEIGKHGLRISFTYHGRRYGSTYLPDVAREQGWTKEETMISLMRKAGWTGRKDDWRKVGDLHVITYQGVIVFLGYREWREWRDWVEEEGLASNVL